MNAAALRHAVPVPRPKRWWASHLVPFSSGPMLAAGLILSGLILGGWALPGFAQETSPTESAPLAAPSKHVRLLTIGNSFTRNATRYLEDLATAAGHQLTHRPVSVGGSSLQFHADKAQAFERDRDDSQGKYADGLSLQQQLKSGEWDYVTVQQVSIQSHNLSTYRPYAGQLQAIIARYAPGAELLVHQTWAYRVDDPRFAPAGQAANRAENQSADQEPRTQQAMFQGLKNAYDMLAQELGARQIPVGDAFYLVDRHSEYGFQPPRGFDPAEASFPELPEQRFSLHVGWRWRPATRDQPAKLVIDGHHANSAGEYLGACVWFETLFGESCQGNPFVPADLEPQYASFLQSAAHQAVVQEATVREATVREATVQEATVQEATVQEATVQAARSELAAAGRRPAATMDDYADPQPQQYQFQARASRLDPEAKEYPEINFVFGSEDKPQDLQHAAVDTRVAPQGKLVIWLMGHNPALFDRLTGYGLHAIQVSYANKWFGVLCRPEPASPTARGQVRLEAATGLDFSQELDLQPHDGMMHRAWVMVRWLAAEHPQGNWQYFLRDDGQGLRWDRVIVSGSSHGSTTAARFAQYQRVDRVVMLCGPRDQDQDWQSDFSATPAERYFGFSHVLDGGWTGDHYCRSWELLGLHEFGPIVNVDAAAPPYADSRRLVSAADVQQDANRAHSAVTPGRASPQDAQGAYLYEPVWRYLYNHPVDAVGTPTQRDPNCDVAR